MRASKLITISTAAILMGSTGLALAPAIGAQGGVSGGSMQNPGAQNPDAIDQGSVSGRETKGANPRAAENPTRRGQISGERGANIQGSRESQHNRAMTSERGRALGGERGLATGAERGRMITGERGQPMAAERGRLNGERGLATGAERGRAITGERGQAMAAERERTIAGQRGLAAVAERGRATTGQGRQSFGQPQTIGPAYARATERNLGAGLSAQERARLRDIVSSRRDIPRVSSLGEVRVNGVVPRGVRLVAVPEEIVRVYPRFRRDQAFRYRNRLVVVDPATSRIVAVLRT